jgi:hypothetical protein
MSDGTGQGGSGGGAKKSVYGWAELEAKFGEMLEFHQRCVGIMDDLLHACAGRDYPELEKQLRGYMALRPPEPFKIDFEKTERSLLN